MRGTPLHLALHPISDGRKFHRAKKWPQSPRTQPQMTRSHKGPLDYITRKQPEYSSHTRPPPQNQVAVHAGACSEDFSRLSNTRENVLGQQGLNFTRMLLLLGKSRGPTGWELPAAADTLDLPVIFAIDAFQPQPLIQLRVKDGIFKSKSLHWHDTFL